MKISIVIKVVTLVVLSVFIPTSAVAYLGSHQTSEIVKQDNITHNQSRSELIADYTSNYFATIKAHLVVFAGRPDIIEAANTGNFAPVQKAITSFAETQHSLESVGIFDPDGILKVHSIAATSMIGESFADRDWFNTVVSTGMPDLSAPLVSRVTGNPISPCGVPIINESGELIAILSGDISLNGLIQALNLDGSPTHHSTIIDLRSGIVAADSVESHLMVLFESEYQEAVNLMRTGVAGNIETVIQGNPSRLVSFTPLHDLPLGVLVSTPLSAIAEQLSVLNRQAAMTAAVTGGIAALLAAFLAFNFTRPIRRLTRSTQEIGRGNFNTPLNIHNSDEIGVLATAFQDMAAQLQTTLVSRDQLQAEIAEKLLTEKKLSAAADEWRSTFDSISDMVAIVDSNHRIGRINQAFADKLGKSPQELIGKHCYEVIHSMNQPHPMCPHARTLETLKVESSEYFDTKLKIWVEAVSSPVFDAKQQLMGSVHIIKDISQRKQAEQELKEMSVHQQTILSAVPDIIMEVDNNKVYTWANQAGLDFFGDDVVGKDASYYFEGEQTTYDIVQPVFDGTENNVYVESWQRRQDGQKRLLAWWCRSLKDSHGKVIGGLSVATDITERKESEIKLLESKEQLNKAQMIAHLGSWVWHIQTNQLEWSDEMFRIFGIEKDGFSGDLPDVIGRAIHPDDRSAVEASNLAVISDKKPVPLEYRIIRPDGNIRTVWAEAGELILGDDGQPAILSGIVQDITDQKLAEAEQRQLQDKAEMSSRLAAVGEMAAGIAHEINNPLTGVIGFSELLLERPGIPDDIKEELTIINVGSQRVKEIVRRMLTFARQAKPVKSAVSIEELLEITLELRSYVLKTANIEVIRDYAPDLPWVMADAGQLQQVFLNLIVNAEYAMKKAHDTGVLTVKTAHPDGYIRISITDDGSGMTDEVKSKLFQPFFTTKEPGEGTGLGLSLSLGIINEHGGSIRVESKPGTGTTFFIELPVTQLDTIPQAKPESVHSEQVMRKSRILVVDDEPSVGSLIKTILNSQGHEVVVCQDPQQGLDRLSEGTFDCIILDIRMPGMSGIELYNLIKQRWQTLADRVMFVTGDTSDLVTREYLKSHDIPYIVKPFDRTNFLDAVNKLLSLK
ncbi:MAG: PAS domain S-box protein [Dehalogenimonas sp.]|uniref:histidine kinase n=1 Tax=Candidatus Dehalogenimonas loeffleri TaxID=3127115 RepID=A0ABZ2J1N9_9CHLR|nr:PAS domain S-box protein [Dehalogenimonas sp.]